MAFRQAKRAVATERGGLCLLDFASYELALSSNLLQLRRKLKNGAWFSSIDPGTLVVAPKATFSPQAPKDVVRVGRRQPAQYTATVRLLLAPKPDYVVTEVLYLWEFGPALESLLDPSCVGYRLKRVASEGEMDRSSHDVYEYWPRAFQRYRDDPVNKARSLLQNDERVQVVSSDVKSFFDSINPAFLLKPVFISRLAAAASRLGRRFDAMAYRVATETLLRAYRRFFSQAGTLGAESPVGVPIGSLTSRLFANVALSSFDAQVCANPQVKLYRRYVDDMVLVRVAPPTEDFQGREEILRAVFPGFAANAEGSRFVVPATRETFELSAEKTRIHELQGEAGISFLAAVSESFALVSSERRAFLGNLDALENEIESIDLFDDAANGGAHIPRLRDADRFTLRRFVAGAFVRTLERYALLLDKTPAREEVGKRVQKILLALEEAAPFENLDLVLDLLRVATLLQDGALKLRIWTWLKQHDVESLGHVDAVRWGNRTLTRSAALRALREYLAQRKREVLATVSNYNSLGAHDGRLLRHADLRHLDREDEAVRFGMPPPLPQVTTRGHRFLRSRVSGTVLAARLDRIEAFVEACKADPHDPWGKAEPLSLLLAGRPPRHGDVSRRFLANIEGSSVRRGGKINATVDALRGTRYAKWSLGATVSRDGRRATLALPGEAAQNVRVIVANLPVDESAFLGAAQGTPVLSVRRMDALDQALREARRANREAKSHKVPSVLVLPELSIPRAWIRAVVAHAVSEEMSIVAGLEYRDSAQGLVNEATGIFPLGKHTVAQVVWTKRRPAVGEAGALKKLAKRLAPPNPTMARLLVRSPHGTWGVLICSELLEAGAIAELSGGVELLVVPAWNQDTSSFDHMSHSVASMLVHCFVAISNNAEHSDSRIVAPIREPRHKRDWARIVHRGHSRVIWGDLPVGELREFHSGRISSNRSAKDDDDQLKFRPLPPGWRE